jgi:hypothetical protein
MKTGRTIFFRLLYPSVADRQEIFQLIFIKLSHADHKIGRMRKSNDIFAWRSRVKVRKGHHDEEYFMS